MSETTSETIETTLQDGRRAASHTLTTYAQLRSTALSFIGAQAHKGRLASKMDFAALQGVTTAGYTHRFGPSFSVAQSPSLRGEFDFARFRAHLEGMLRVLDRWEMAVEGAVVDEVGHSAVVRVRYTMYVEGAEGVEGVENDVVWWLELEEERGGGQGWKVGKSTEIVDFGASARIRELMMGGKGGGVGRDGQESMP